MAGVLDTYNAEIMAEDCPKCKIQPGKRCFAVKGGGSLQPSHRARRIKAGWQWNHTTKQLERIAGHEAVS
jgi:hypothetical protein